MSAKGRPKCDQRPLGGQRAQRARGGEHLLSIREIDHVVLRVRDLDRALAFYRDVLGCSVQLARPQMGLWQLRAGRSMIDLVPVDGKLGAAGGAPLAKEGRSMDHE